MKSGIGASQALALPVGERGEALLEVVEDQWFDRKDPKVSPLALANTEISFANADGGVIVIGLSNRKVVGTDAFAKHRNELVQAAINFTDPPVRTQVQLVECINQTKQLDHLLVIEIEPSEKVHANQRDEVFLRVGDEDRKLSFKQRQELIYDKGQALFEATVVGEASMAELDDELLEQYAAAVGHPEPKRLLEARSLTKPSGQVTMACVLLFGNNPQRFVPEGYIRVLRYTGTQRGAGAKQQLRSDIRVEGSILRALPLASNAVRKVQPTRRALTPEGRFGEVASVPEKAWLEGLVNAAIHRSYSLGGDHIRVEVFDDRIEVESPGRFPGLIGWDNPLRATRFARNPRIARVCSDFGFGQELGEGIRRMFQEMRDAGLSDPLYEQTSASVKLTLSAIPVDREITQRLSRGSNVIVALLQRMGPLGTGEIAEYIDLSRPAVLRRLNDLRDTNLIGWQGKSPKDPGAVWFIK